MQERRKPQGEITPAYEDRGIFKTETCQLDVQVYPVFTYTGRRDFLVKGFFHGGSRIEVVFAGRRARQAQPLQQRLRTMLNQVAAQVGSMSKVKPEEVRLDLRVVGAWRPRFVTDRAGGQIKQLQLYAALWAFRDKSGKTVSYGEHLRR